MLAPATRLPSRPYSLAALYELWKMFVMMFLSLASTSSNVQESLSLFCDISRADVATPPALAALAGPKRTPAFWNTAIASGVEGILAPSATANTPLATRALADSSLISFCVAHGRAMSHLIVQMPLQPSWYSAPCTLFTYSLILPLSTSLICLTTSRLMPFGSYT